MRSKYRMNVHIYIYIYMYGKMIALVSFDARFPIKFPRFSRARPAKSCGREKKKNWRVETCRGIIYSRLMKVVFFEKWGSERGTLNVEKRGKIGGERGERQPRLLVTAILLAKVALPTPEWATYEASPTDPRSPFAGYNTRPTTPAYFFSFRSRFRSRSSFIDEAL